MLLGYVDELKKRQVQCINVGDRSFVLIYRSDQFYLLDNLCPHKSAALCDGQLNGDEIQCPWHQARFDIKTGRGLSPLAGKGVNSWPLAILDGQLMAEIAFN